MGQKASGVEGFLFGACIAGQRVTAPVICLEFCCWLIWDLLGISASSFRSL